MPSDARVYTGTTSSVAIDSSTDPSFLPNNVDWIAVNRQYRNGKNRTRNPFVSMAITLADGQDASVLTDFQTQNFQGAMAYQAISADAQSGFVAAVGGSIYFLSVSNRVLTLSLLITGNDPSMMHTWFVQAEDWVYIQNGYQNPIAWDGVNAAFRLNPAANQMPIGTIMAYSNGRVFVSDAFNNVYASDIIFGSGFTTTSNTQNFTETTYWAEGGSFTPPANLGLITGMRVAPALGFNQRGQGELVIMCQNGAFTLNTNLPRSTWQDAQIQTTSLIGRGCLSPWSVTGMNNEVFYRSEDGWSLYRNSQGDFSNRLTFRKLSREVNRWVDQDTKWLRQFASAMFFDNRLIATVSPFTVRDELETTGLHRPHRAMVVLDLDQMTATSPDADLTFRWNGLWEGPQPTQLITAQFDGQQRAFAFSYDSDGFNRIYELVSTGANDIVDDRHKKIKSYYMTKRFDFTDTQQTNGFIRKKINGGNLWLSDMPEEVTTSVSFRADHYPCWNPIIDRIASGCDYCDVDRQDCTFPASENRYRKLNFPTPDDECQIDPEIQANMGAEFQILVEFEGVAQVDRMRISASLQDNAEAPIGTCENDQHCDPILCCSQPEFGFYRIA